MFIKLFQEFVRMPKFYLNFVIKIWNQICRSVSGRTLLCASFFVSKKQFWIVSYGKYLSIVASWIYKLFNSSTLLLRITERLHCKSSSSSLFKSRVFSVVLTSVSLKVQSVLYSFNIFNILQMKFRIERNIWLEIFDSQRFLLYLIRP